MFNAAITPAAVAERIKRKISLGKGAEVFNEKPKSGILYFQEFGFLSVPPTAKEIAQVLKSTSKISKKILGEYLAKPGMFFYGLLIENASVLTEFIGQFNFEGRRIDQGLRLLLESFRLPGESQQIERIMETFAGFYVASNKQQEIASRDAAFVLSYSVIMLNTDQHNPQVKKRMTFEDFSRNTRGVNDGVDFSKEYLLSIFNAIHSDEIIMPAEHEA